MLRQEADARRAAEEGGAGQQRQRVLSRHRGPHASVLAPWASNPYGWQAGLALAICQPLCLSPATHPKALPALIQELLQAHIPLRVSVQGKSPRFSNYNLLLEPGWSRSADMTPGKPASGEQAEKGFSDWLSPCTGVELAAYRTAFSVRM